ncbi:hypothetical protein BH11BAC2_BH11BAC2_23820 [soil metagenome]
MKIKIIIISILFALSYTVGLTQNTDRFWAFGDSAAIDFSNLNNPVPSYSILRSRGTCASICDSAGNLLFYCGTPNVPMWLAPNNVDILGYIINKNHQIMDNGDSLIGELWYQEMIIIPNPGNANQYYVFTAGVLSPFSGLFYSIVDLSYNNGLGKVIQKNIQLNSDYACDGITAIKHGNGRDWWLIFRNWTYSPIYSNEIKVYYISTSGISANQPQNIGTQMTNQSFIRSKFNSQGNKLYSVPTEGLIETYNFDRCSGILSNPITIANLFGGTFDNYWSFALSPDESKIYVTSIYQTANQDSSYLIQFDLNATNFLASADTLGAFLAPSTAGILQLGPDGKIYLSVTWAGSDSCYDYLYCYGTVNTTNSNISVINFPDSSGAACDFQAFSFYLGGHKAYWGLPNNPNYELAKDSGSVCDTLSVGLNELVNYQNNIFVYYDTPGQTAFINAKGLRGKNYILQIFNMNGQVVLSEAGKLDSEYYTMNAVLTNWSDGMYVVRLSTEKEILTTKFVKN